MIVVSDACFLHSLSWKNDMLAILCCRSPELHSKILRTPILRTTAQHLPISLVSKGRHFAVVFIPQGLGRDEPKAEGGSRWELWVPSLLPLAHGSEWLTRELNVPKEGVIGIVNFL